MIKRYVMQVTIDVPENPEWNEIDPYTIAEISRILTNTLRRLEFDSAVEFISMTEEEED
jgi:hypothetical protein